jgi:hypothetical protein
MKKTLSLFIIAGMLTTGIQSLTAQDKTAAGKLVYAELAGPGIIMSMNFDSRFQSNTRLGFGYRLGVGIIESYMNNANSFMDLYEYFTKNNYSFPVGLNYVFGKPNMVSGFEIGAGITLLTQKVSLYNWGVKKPGNIVGHLAFMYRRTPLKKAFSFRGGFTPMIGTAGNLFPMGAVSFGYAF